MAENFEKNDMNDKSELANVVWWTLDDLNSLKNDKTKEVKKTESTWDALNNLGDALVNSKLEELQNKIEDTLLDSALESSSIWESNDQITKGQIDKFFEKWKEEFYDDKKTVVEDKFTQKYKNIEDRSVDVAKWIENSADKIIDEIKNWEKEQNPVARSLLRFVNRIMKSEK